MGAESPHGVLHAGSSIHHAWTGVLWDRSQRQTHCLDWRPHTAACVEVLPPSQNTFRPVKAIVSRFRRNASFRDAPGEEGNEGRHTGRTITFACWIPRLNPAGRCVTRTKNRKSDEQPYDNSSWFRVNLTLKSARRIVTAGHSGRNDRNIAKDRGRWHSAGSRC